MISGHLQDLIEHFPQKVVEPLFDFVQDFLQQHQEGLSALALGKYPLALGMFALVIKTPSRTLPGQQFEAHRKYLDLHYLVSGKEVLAFTSAYALHVATPYNGEDDYLLYYPPGWFSQLSLQEKQFVLFFPEDAHCAQGHLSSENQQQILKIVFKIPVSLVKPYFFSSQSARTSQALSPIKILPVSNFEEALPILLEHDKDMQNLNFPNSSPQKELVLQRLREEFNHGAGYFFVYEGEKIIGSLLLQIKENPYRGKKYGDIRNIYLTSACRGKGYGQQMLLFADDFFKKQGCSYAFAGIAAHNPASNALFEKAGYSKTRFILEKDYSS